MQPGPATTLARRCRAAGLDLAAPLQAGWYNESVAREHRLPDFGDPASTVVLIGNTRELWPRFLAALRACPARLADDDPLDRFVEETVRGSLETLGLPAQVRWAHRPEPHHIAMQQLAGVAGLAWRSPASLLSVHPVYGPWIGLRAAVVLPLPGPPKRPRAAPPCSACDAACAAALAKTSAGDWRGQLAVRDACPVGRAYRYSDTQIEYHYTRSRDLLREAVRTGDFG